METNCPNCGAPIQGVKCEYCGSMFYDFSELPLDLQTPTYVKIKVPHMKQNIMMKVIFDNLERSIRMSNELNELQLHGYILKEVYF